MYLTNAYYRKHRNNRLKNQHNPEAYVNAIDYSLSRGTHLWPSLLPSLETPSYLSKLHLALRQSMSYFRSLNSPDHCLFSLKEQYLLRCNSNLCLGLMLCCLNIVPCRHTVLLHPVLTPLRFEFEIHSQWAWLAAIQRSEKVERPTCSQDPIQRKDVERTTYKATYDII